MKIMNSVDNLHVLAPWLICFMMLSDDLDSWQAGVNFQMITWRTEVRPHDEIQLPGARL